MLCAPSSHWLRKGVLRTRSKSSSSQISEDDFFAANKQYKLFSHDVKQAYLQSAESLEKDVFVKPQRKDRKCLGVEKVAFKNIKLPFHDKEDYGKYWGVTLDKHDKQDFKLSPVAGYS